jgi:predicted HTH domain antitoxin
MKESINVNLDKSILVSLKQTKAGFVKELLLNNAIALYREGRLSMGKAAQMAGIDRISFMFKMRDKGIPIFEMDETEFQDMIEETKQVYKKIHTGK